MDVKMYFNNKATLERFISNDNKTRTDEYSEPIDIKCRIEGKIKYIRNEQNELSVSEQSFWTTEDIKVKDRINGQYVISVNPIYDFDGSLIYIEAFV